MNKLSPLDEGLHNNLHEFEAPVSDAHWDRLSSALDNKKKRPVYVKFFIPLLVMGVAGITGWYLATIPANANQKSNEKTVSKNTDLPSLATDIGAEKREAQMSSATTDLNNNNLLPFKKANTAIVLRPSAILTKTKISIDETVKESATVGHLSMALAERKTAKFNYTVGSMTLPTIFNKNNSIALLLPNKQINQSKYELALIPSVGFYSVNYIGMNIPSNYPPTPAGDGLISMVSNADLQGANYGFTFYGRKFVSNRFYLSAGMGLNMSKQTIHYVITNNVRGYSIKDGFLNYTNVEVPLGMGYRLSSYASKGAFYVEPGVNIMAVRNTRANLFNLETELQENVKMNTALINPRLALHFKHSLGAIKLNAFYQVRYSRYTTNSSYHYTIGGFQHQIGIGLSKDF